MKPDEGGRATSGQAGTLPKQAIKMMTEQAKEKVVMQGREQLAPKEREGENAPHATASDQMVGGVGMAVAASGEIASTGGRKLAQRTAERIKQRRENDLPVESEVRENTVPDAALSQPSVKQEAIPPMRERVRTDAAPPTDRDAAKQPMVNQRRNADHLQSPEFKAHEPKTKNASMSKLPQKPHTVGRAAPRTMKGTQANTPTFTAAVRRKQTAATRPAILKLAREKAAIGAKAGSKALQALKRVLANLLAALQSLISAVAAASAMAAALVVTISLVAFIAGSAYGIFFAAEPTGSGTSVRDAIAQLNEEYRDRLEEISSTVQHDRQEIQSNDGSYAINWQDVLTVFSSRVSGAADGEPVAVLDEALLEQLREIMWDMNVIESSTHTETHEIPLPHDNNEDEAEEEVTPEEEALEEPQTVTVTETVLVFELTHKTPEEMATAYSYTPRQQQYLETLADPQNDELWLELLGSFTPGGGILMPGGDWGGDGTLQWPLPIAGSITSSFGYRADPVTGETSYHSGTDIAAPNGTPILAAADGVVVIANGVDSWGGSYGYYVKLNHGNGLQTLYAHCSGICVTAGQQVQAGQVIGYVGSTGRSTGNHLHFEVTQNDSRMDGMMFFGG